MLYHFGKSWKAAQSFRDLNELFGQCRERLARFKSNDTSLQDKPGRGRPSDLNDQALLAAVKDDESLPTRMQSTIIRHLKKLGKVWKLAGWVAHELRQQQS